jgi:hypothetical protein
MEKTGRRPRFVRGKTGNLLVSTFLQFVFLKEHFFINS